MSKTNEIPDWLKIKYAAYCLQQGRFLEMGYKFYAPLPRNFVLHYNLIQLIYSREKNENRH